MITCEERRNRGDMLQMFRFTKGFHNPPLFVKESTIEENEHEK
jgi:hypothetical protein